MKILFPVFVAYVLGNAAYAGGLVCVDSITTNDTWQANTTGATTASVFTVSIDGHSPQTITTTRCGVFTNLDVSSEHLVRITRDGKPDASFKFSFQKQRSEHLRLWYNTFYGTWQLWKPGGKHKCASLAGEASNQPPEVIRPKTGEKPQL